MLCKREEVFGVGQIVDPELGSQYSLEKTMVMLNVALLHYIISDMFFRTNLQSISFLLLLNKIYGQLTHTSTNSMNSKINDHVSF
jgi:hypothetical protein